MFPPTLTLALLAAFLLLCPRLAPAAGIAYGTVNNFDTVNDTSNICHGFEIELDDIRSSDVTYTYDYNHYGTPSITEDTWSSPGHTNVFVRYQAVWTNDSGWSAYTAIPAGPIAPTDGHQFTNPGTNFGGEHFGVGFRVQPTKVLYFWMVDTGNHVLSRGGQVSVSTPTFTYSAAAAGVPAQIAAVIPAPVPIRPPTYEFSDASWVKVITTTSHTNTEVRVTDLMTPDPDNPNERDWRNGQTNIEVETEWQLLQIDYNSSDYNPTNGIGGPNGKLAGPIAILGRVEVIIYLPLDILVLTDHVRDHAFFEDEGNRALQHAVLRAEVVAHDVRHQHPLHPIRLPTQHRPVRPRHIEQFIGLRRP